MCGDILNNWDDHIKQFTNGQQTWVSVSWVDLNSLETNIFTKAWLESKSR